MENIETLLAALAQTQGFDDEEEVVSAGPKVGGENPASSPEIYRDSAASQSIGVALEVCGDSRPVEVADRAPRLENPVAGVAIGAGEKRKRGRPPRGQLAAKPLPPPPPPPPQRKKQEDEEEDVCFICFDGGSLVLCDRKGCPKAYHPACIKRDEAFFRSKAKWNCGWHICSVCQKGSYYTCYTCTYSLCKGCTKETDYLCVRGNKGFCATCMGTIMLIENYNQANNNSVQVDFDDQGSWEYLFKVYWICLKEKLSLTLNELIHAKKPWKGGPAVACKPQLSNVRHTAHDEKVYTYRSYVQPDLNKPQEESSLLQNNQVSSATLSIGNHGEKLISNKGEDGPSRNNYIGKTSMDKDINRPTIDNNTDILSIDEVTDESNFAKTIDTIGTKNGYSENIVEDTNRLCISKYIGDPRERSTLKLGIDTNAEWASKDLLEFVGHMKNGDTSALSQFDVQTLLLHYIKRNKLRDPRQKSQIICDDRLKNLFGKPRVGHIEMLKLLDYHFLVKEDSQKNSFIPAGFVGPIASDIEVDVNNCRSSMSCGSKKRKTRKKCEARAPQNNLNEYAAIDAHNINLIYLRRNLLENLIKDKDNFHDKVVGSIVRIKIITNDQRQDTFRLVQVVGTCKIAEPYKIGDQTTDVMLEVLNLNKKEVVSIDAISNSAFIEDECKRLRQSIRCGLGTLFTVGEVHKKAMALQPVRIDDWLEAEIVRLNHLRDRANEKGHKKELREYVRKLQMLKTPEERQRRISEVPEIHDDPKMSPGYESEEDAKSCHKNEYVRPGYSVFSGNGRNAFYPNKNGIEEGSTLGQNKIIEKIDASGVHSSEKLSNQISITNSAIGGRKDQAMLRSGSETSTATHSIGTSNNIETEKLWHYRDPNGKVQGPFAMVQLRKWNTTGLFPPDMRIWTNHEQYDSLLLVDALNRQFHGASETPCVLSSESRELGATGGAGGINATASDSKQTEATLYNANILSENRSGYVRADESSSSLPQGWNLLKNNNSRSDDVQTCSLLPSSSLAQTSIALPDLGQDPENKDDKSSELPQNRMISAHELQDQYNNQSRAEVNLRSSSIDLSAMASVSVFAPLSQSPNPIKQDGVVDISNPPNPAPVSCNKQWEVQTDAKQQSVSSDVSIQHSGIFELLSPTPRSNSEEHRGQAEMKRSNFINFIVPHSGPDWNNDSGSVADGLQLPEAADEWCGYSPTPVKPSVQVWNSDLVSPSSLKPSEVISSDNVTNSTSNGNQLTLTSSSTIPNWLAIFNEPIELDALGEESVSDLLAEVDAMESQGGFPSPTSAMKFAKELIQDCKDDCFSSLEFSPLPDPGKRDAFSSTRELHLSCQSSVSCKPVAVHSSASSEGETNAPLYTGDTGSDFHTPAPNASQEMVRKTMVLGMGTETNDPGFGTVQGNINLVTVQGNVNLVLGGPSQGMADLGWGANQGSAWPNPNVNLPPINGSLPWDSQRKYIGERFTSPREWAYQGGDAGFGRSRPPWGRQPYGGGGYLRPPVKGQRVCKFYESGRCKKGAFCDYLHP